MLRRNRIFRDRTHPFDTDIWWWINFQEIQIETRRHCDLNWLHWEGHWNGLSDQFLKLTQLLLVIPVTWRSLPVVVVSKTCVANWSEWVRTALCREFYFDPSVGSVLLPHRDWLSQKSYPVSSLYSVHHCPFVGSEHIGRSNATSFDKTDFILSKVCLLHHLMCFDFHDYPRNKHHKEKVKIKKN